MATREERAAEAAATLSDHYSEGSGDPATEVVTEVPPAVEESQETPPESAKTDQNEPNSPENNAGFEALARAEARSRELYEQQQTALKAEKEEILSAKEQLKEFNDWKKRFREKPLEAVRGIMGQDMSDDDIVGMFYGSLPGVDAGASDTGNQQDARLDRMERENKELRDQIEQKEQNRSQQDFQRSYINDITSHLRAEETRNDPNMAILNAYFDEYPQEVVADIFGSATTMAAENPNGPLVKPDEVAKNVNERLTKIFGPVVEARVKALTEGKTPAAIKKTPADNRTLMNSSAPTTKADDGKQLSRKQIRDNAIAWAKAGNIDLG